MATIEEVLDVALAQHRAGRWPQAEQLYRQILDLAPHHADARQGLGLLAHQTGRHDLAVQCLLQAIALNPRLAGYHVHLGGVYLELGRLDEAIACFHQSLRLEPNLVDAHGNLGNAYLAQNKYDEARACYRRALDLQPDLPEAYYGLSKAHQMTGDLPAASDFCRRAIELKPDFAEAYNRLGVLLHQRGLLNEAQAQFEQAVRLLPDWSSAYSNLGAVLQANKKPEEAISCFRRALEIQPQNVDALANLAFVLKNMGRCEEAVAACRQAIALNPNYAAAHVNLANALQTQNRNIEAVDGYRRAIELEPDSPGAYCGLGDVLRLLGRLDEAAASCRRALEIEPGNYEGHNSLALCLRDQGQLVAAVEQLRLAIDRQPKRVRAYNNLSVVLQELGEFDAAAQCLETVLALDPDDAEAHWNRALNWLRAGDFARGWPEYEWRWRCRSTPPRAFSQPLWDGSDFAGRVLLLHAEQGMGDTIQFVRYAPLVKQRGGTVLLECHRPLARLLAGCEGIDGIVPRNDPMPAFDLQIPLLSLPGIFPTADHVPAKVPYIAPPVDLAERWGEALGSRSGLRVGIAWQGSFTHSRDLFRSIPLEMFLPLAAIPGVRLYSLQTGTAGQQLSMLSLDPSIEDLGGRVEDFADTAAILMHLDLVITCDSSPAHLAGAMGVPVWVALPFSPDWRWSLGRDDSLWYPTMRLFRQPQVGDWHEVFDVIAKRLREQAAAHSIQVHAQSTHTRGHDAGLAEVHFQSGKALRLEGRHEEAIGEFRQAIGIDPRHTHAYGELAVVLRAVRRADESRSVCLQALEIEPQNPVFWSQLGTAWLDLGKPAEAVPCYREAVRLAPHIAEAHRDLAVALRLFGEFGEATACCRQALRLEPNLASAHNTLGTCLHEQGQLNEALGEFRECLDLDPRNLHALKNLAAVQHDLGQCAAALESLDAALAINPLDAEAHRNRAMFWLADGDFARGWHEYEWRWRSSKARQRGLTQPRWEGADFHGRVLLIYADQGLGDALQFVRYAALVKQRGGTVLLECQASLTRLLQSCAGLDGIVRSGDALPAFDLQVPLTSLPGIFHTDLNSIPAAVPYLKPPADVVERWANELAGAAGFKVGIAWQGSFGHGRDRFRSIPLEFMARLAAIPQLRLYSLQTGDARQQLEQFAGRWPIEDVGGRVKDFADTAAVMQQLDLVISCDSSPVHLAGALGVPVWVALPYSADWRWLRDREDSPWYPTVRLFRQRQFGNWHDVFAAVEARLRERVVGRPDARPQHQQPLG